MAGIHLTKSNTNNTLAILLLLVLSFIWGSSFIIIKKGLEVYSPVQVGTLRITFSFLALLPFAINYFKEYIKKYWLVFLGYGLLANVIPAILFSIAETGLSSSITGVLNALTPIFTMLAGFFFFRYKTRITQILGLAIGLAGSIILSFVGSSGGLGTFNYYVIFVVIATICYGISGNIVKKYFQELKPLPLTASVMLMIGPFSLFALLVFTDFIDVFTNKPGALEAAGYIFILGAVGTAFALVLFNKLIQITSPVYASVVTYLIPITAVAWGVADGEPFFSAHFLGMALVIIGVYILNLKKYPRFLQTLASKIR